MMERRVLWRSLTSATMRSPTSFWKVSTISTRPYRHTSLRSDTYRNHCNKKPTAVAMPIWSRVSSN